MKPLSLALLLIFAASCGTPTGVKDGMLSGRWRSGMDFLDADQYNVFVATGVADGATGGPVSILSGRRFDAQARLRLRNPSDSTQPIEGTAVRLIGRVDMHTGKVLLSIVDSASGVRYFTRWLDPWRPSGPPPSTPPVPR